MIRRGWPILAACIVIGLLLTIPPFHGRNPALFVHWQDRLRARDQAKERVWLSVPSGIPRGNPQEPSRALAWQISFIGRKSLVPDQYGHMDMFTADIEILRMISREPDPVTRHLAHR